MEPLGQLRAMAIGYLRCVARNPAHFEVVSRRRAIKVEVSQT
jgi:hypothetical protein